MCEGAAVLADSPRRKAVLQEEEVVEAANGTTPADALGVSDLIDHSDTYARLDVKDPSGKSRQIQVALNKEKPRLGASCDLTGWHKNSVSAAGNESLTVFDGPYALTVSGILDKKLAFMRVRVSNHSDQPLPVNASLFSVLDGSRQLLKVLSPAEVMYFMHGPDGVTLIKPPDHVKEW